MGIQRLQLNTGIIPNETTIVKMTNQIIKKNYQYFRYNFNLQQILVKTSP